MSSRGGHTEWENVVHFSTYFWSQTGPLGAPKLDLNSCQAWLPSVTANEVHFWCTKTRPTSEPKLDHFWSHWIHPPPQGPTTNLQQFFPDPCGDETSSESAFARPSQCWQQAKWIHDQTILVSSNIGKGARRHQARRMKLAVRNRHQVRTSRKCFTIAKRVFVMHFAHILHFVTGAERTMQVNNTPVFVARSVLFCASFSRLHRT